MQLRQWTLSWYIDSRNCWDFRRPGNASDTLCGHDDSLSHKTLPSSSMVLMPLNSDFYTPLMTEIFSLSQETVDQFHKMYPRVQIGQGCMPLQPPFSPFTHSSAWFDLLIIGFWQMVWPRPPPGSRVHPEWLVTPQAPPLASLRQMCGSRSSILPVLLSASVKQARFWSKVPRMPLSRSSSSVLRSRSLDFCSGLVAERDVLVFFVSSVGLPG